MTDDRKRVKSVDTTCEIIEAIKEHNGAGVTQLADDLGYAKSAIHKHLVTLKDNNYVVGRDGEYRVSLQFLEMAEHVKEQLGVYDIVRKAVDDLAAETGEVVQFAIEEHEQAVCLYKSRGEDAVETASSIGERERLHSTALGKTILAYLPEERVHNILDNQGMPERTPNTITDRDELFKHLEEIRQQGYAVDDQENIRGLRCVGAPVIGPEENIFGALSVSGPARRMNQERIDTELKEHLLNAANVIQINSKFNSPDMISEG